MSDSLVAIAVVVVVGVAVVVAGAVAVAVVVAGAVAVGVAGAVAVVVVVVVVVGVGVVVVVGVAGAVAVAAMKQGPSVLAIMPTRGRPLLAERARDNFVQQTYSNRNLAVLDNSHRTIGAARNLCVELGEEYDIIVHWDDDDWSHPKRIEEQVELLINSGADCVGYRDMLFFDTRTERAYVYTYPAANYALGTSLCYWRSSWDKHGPFEDLPGLGSTESEYWRFLQRCKLRVAPNFYGCIKYDPSRKVPVIEPRMIATIHGANIVQKDPEIRVQENPADWRRAPEWDEYCRRRIK